MILGLNKGRIVDYGVAKSKSGASQVFVHISIGGEVVKHYMYPFKKDGEVNDYVMQQLVYAGFDPLTMTIDALAFGVESDMLITNEDLDIFAKEETNNMGQLQIRVSSLGAMVGNRLSYEETKALITPDQISKVKAFASKYTARVRVKKEDLSEEIGF
jgi:hypothetical protein